MIKLVSIGTLPSMALILILSLLGACTNSSDDYSNIKKIVAPGQVGFVPRFVALIDAGDAVPALEVALVKRDTGSIILLESHRDGIDTWLTPDGAAFAMRQGMLVRTQGFANGLMASDVEQSLAMVLGGQTGRSERYHTFLTGNDETVTRTYLCDIENHGAKTILIGKSQTQTRLMVEDCRSLDQTFQNLYWVSGSGQRIVQARQWAGDYLGEIVTRVVPR